MYILRLLTELNSSAHHATQQLEYVHPQAEWVALTIAIMGKWKEGQLSC